MSTPLGKPPGPIDLSAYALQKARERTGTEQEPSGSDHHFTRSPYAPKLAHERADEPRSAASDHELFRSPYAPKKARATPSVALDPDDRADAESSPLRTPESSARRSAPERHDVDPDEPRLAPDDAPGQPPVAERQHDRSPHAAYGPGSWDFTIDPEAAASLQPAAGADSERPDDDRRDEVMTDEDLERLEASLRWLQRQEAATRLSRPAAPPSPPPRGPAPVDAGDRHHGGERFAERFRSPLSLEPERMAPPPSSRRNLVAPIAALAATMFAAAVLYYLLADGPTPQPAPAPQMASVGTRVVAPTSLAPPESRPVVARDDEPATSIQSEPPPPRVAPPPPARSSERERLAMLPPSPPVAEAPPAAAVEPPPAPVVRPIDPVDVKLLVKQGEQFAATGDLVTARIVFQRAAEAGDATAAMALAATYDPTVLAKLGTVGIGADIAKARMWYAKAESLGSTEAARRLRALANR